MNVEIGTVAVQFLLWEYLFSIFGIGNLALQRQNATPRKGISGLSPNFHIHVSVRELYIPTMGLPVLLEEVCRLILEIYKSLKDT
jgi:hypothetical protein